MKKLIATALILIAGPLMASDTTTTRSGLVKPEESSINWGPKIRANYDIIDSSFSLLAATQTFTGTVTFANVSISSMTLNKVRISTANYSNTTDALAVNGIARSNSSYQACDNDFLNCNSLSQANGLTMFGIGGSQSFVTSNHVANQTILLEGAPNSGTMSANSTDSAPNMFSAKSLWVGQTYGDRVNETQNLSQNYSSFENPISLSTNSAPSSYLYVYNTTTSSDSISVTNVGTGHALKINVSGIPSGGYQNEKGALQIEKLSGSPAPFMVLRDSTTDAQVGTGIFEIWEDMAGSTHNDPIIWIHNQGNASNPFMRVDDQAPDMELVNTSTDNAHGYGKWEPMAIAFQGVDLQINNRAYSNSTFETLAYWHPLSKVDLLPGLYLNPQNVTDDASVVSSSGTSGITFQNLNAHTIGLTAAPNTANSWTLALPDTIGATGNIMYHGGTVANGTFTSRQMKWATDFNYSSTTGVAVSSITATGVFGIPKMSKATIGARTPGSIAEEVFCTDCTTTLTCVSTGTAAIGQYAAQQAANRTTACN